MYSKLQQTKCIIKVMNRAIVLSISLLLHLVSHSLVRLVAIPFRHLSQAAARALRQRAVGFSQGKLAAAWCAPSPSLSAPTTSRLTSASDTTTHTVPHIYNYIDNQTQGVAWTSLTDRKSLFGSQCSIATFCPRYFTISQNQSRKQFF